eukprot:TRINITY_DN10470_c0_g1_i11.p1 TRINITY_DN10470_c0_g1~~TRINITY_DN10470_c0_g1_i11.p1  ORF type:complete len:244 (+),score=14.97 TRINITY_DN10470_c0_g1_i11:63-794(+)
MSGKKEEKSTEREEGRVVERSAPASYYDEPRRVYEDRPYEGYYGRPVRHYSDYPRRSVVREGGYPGYYSGYRSSFDDVGYGVAPAVAVHSGYPRYGGYRPAYSEAVYEAPRGHYVSRAPYYDEPISSGYYESRPTYARSAVYERPTYGTAYGSEEGRYYSRPSYAYDDGYVGGYYEPRYERYAEAPRYTSYGPSYGSSYVSRPAYYDEGYRPAVSSGGSASRALALDAADGKIDGQHFGARIV